MCKFCSSERQFLINSDNNFSHYQCKSCLHVDVSPMPSLEELENYYNKEYDYTKPPTVDLDKRHFFVAKYFEKSTRNISILDIGCANGDFLAGLRHLGFNDLSGIELNKEMGKIAKTREIIVIDGMFNSESFKNQKFDFINLGDVIEHVPNPEILLGDLSNLLAPDGICFISTPNVDNFFSKSTFTLFRMFGVPWSSIDPPAHINLFTHKSLLSLLSDLKFEPISAWPYRVPLFYELGHTHLYRKFREQKNLLNLTKWMLGWASYIILFSLNFLIALLTKKDTGMLYVIKHSDVSTF
jgi:2-polyprenyl-3-methyl-5-hydroxy-6-metoxy-1,4-benzoquinol methylase